MPIKFKDLKGPKGYPIIGNIPQIDRSNLHKQVEGWADEFGTVFKLNLGPTNMMVITEPSIIQQINQDRPSTFKRSQKMRDVLYEGGVDGVFNAEGEDWKRHRSIVAKGLDVRHQQKFYPSLVTVTNRLLSKFEKYANNGEAFNLQGELLRYTVDVTTLLAFGYDVNTLEQKGGVMQEHMEHIFPMIFKRINDPIPWYKIIKSKADKEYDNALKELNVVVDQLIVNAKQQLENNPSLKQEPENLIQSILVEAELQGSFTMEEVRGNLMTLLVAGEDTTAHTINWTVFQLFNQPEVVKNIESLIDEVLGEERTITDYPKNNQLKYIEAVMNESLRFKPIAPILLHQALEDVEIEGYFIQKGQRILTQYRHGAIKDEYFSQAKEFNPGRWLKESKCPVHNMDAFTPFGSGPRFCPGRNLALLEVKSVLSMLYKNFEVELVTPKEDVDEIMAFAMKSTPYKVKLKLKQQ